MGGHCIFLSHWYGANPPTTLDLDTEIFKEKLRFHVFLKIENSKNQYYNCNSIFQLSYQVMDILPWHAENLTFFEQRFVL